MGSEPNLPIKWSITLAQFDTMLNLTMILMNGTCKLALIRLWIYKIQQLFHMCVQFAQAIGQN